MDKRERSCELDSCLDACRYERKYLRRKGKELDKIKRNQISLAQLDLTTIVCCISVNM